MFLSAGIMMQAVGHDRLDGLVGIARQLPMAAFAFALAAVSLMGLPPSGGFTAKYLLLTSAHRQRPVVVGRGHHRRRAARRRLSVPGLNRFLSEPETPSSPRPGAGANQVIALAARGLSILLGLFSLAALRPAADRTRPAAIEGLS
jgi:multicomponent Na+:H+ antiporter subunit D